MTCSFPNAGAGDADAQGIVTSTACYHQETFSSGAPEVDNNFGNYRNADLELIKTGKISYSITVKNNGPSVATNVVVDDYLPGNLNWSIKTITPDEA